MNNLTYKVRLNGSRTFETDQVLFLIDFLNSDIPRTFARLYSPDVHYSLNNYEILVESDDFPCATVIHINFEFESYTEHGYSGFRMYPNQPFDKNNKMREIVNTIESEIIRILHSTTQEDLLEYNNNNNN